MLSSLAQGGRVALQVALLSAVWWCAQWVSIHYVPQLPGGVLGMLVLLVLLASGKVPFAWFSHGANWLLSELLLFFIPAVVAIVKFRTLLYSAGGRILLVIVLSTALVMLCTALVVDACGRWQRVRQRRIRLQAQAEGV